MSNPLVDELQEMGAIPSIELALPTLGAFYPQNNALQSDADPANMVIGPLSMLDESSINDPMMMVSGRAIVKLIKRIAPKVDNPQELCELDIQAMLIACRMVSYGNELQITQQCPHCEYENTMQIDLNEHIQNFAPYTEEQIKHFEMETSIGQKVNLKPISYEDAINLTISAIKTNIGADEIDNASNDDILTNEYIEMYRKQFEQALESNVDALVSTIYYVTTKSNQKVDDRELIKGWLQSLPLIDIKAITKRVTEINTDIQNRSKLDYECQQCHKTASLFVELDPQKLFTPAEDSEPEKSSSAKPKNTGKTTKKSSKASGRLS